MPARNGIVEEAAPMLFWEISDAFPEFRHRLRYEIEADSGRICVYFPKTDPQAVLTHITDEFLKNRNLNPRQWEPVTRRNERWEPFDERAEAKVLVDFGWRYYRSILIEPYPSPSEVAKKIVSHFPEPVADASPDMPAFLRKIMD